MRKLSFVLGLLFVLGLYQTSVGQPDPNTTEVRADRFAYSCGVLAGANFKDLGLSEDLIALDRIWTGIEDFMTGDSKRR
jgi:hypothetical protein